ncbi:phosphoribosylformylglycinamidine synthase subunit PurQ [Rhodomicrobium vannielii ATCC 17100]|uniref:phosphoribosylformylglycinamidine synthase subunit PurQ n=1 Tax=Rhodomicrobium vannielii TaxID=1069 RepID=UPI00191A500C|nr:phosphoribosylformylglycinamidine synthase subunit PurQ [Rhodomicrobium vannielii]MBJ7533024.1 phosphoribosylformylglycinamidine synthase subunit PurQ [Rhodomicrobium vannielii ATCC 17100]
MKAAVIVFPGSNCDRDAAVTLEAVTGVKPAMVWHGDESLPKVDLIVLPGGFSYGDYLRSGAMAAQSPIVRAVKAEAERGVAVLGICNGFQILTETGLLPGALMRNSGLNFICRDVDLTVERADTAFTNAYTQGERVTIPIAHKDGSYFADDETLDRIEGEGQVVFRYATAEGGSGNPNGSRRDIAGLIDRTGRIMGLMPHPERAADAALGGIDGRRLFESLTRTLN